MLKLLQHRDNRIMKYLKYKSCSSDFHVTSQRSVAVLRWSRGHPQFLALYPEFGMTQQKIVTTDNITLLCRSKRLRIRNLLAM